MSPFLPFSAKEIWEQLSFGEPLEKGGWDAAPDLRVEPGRKIQAPKPVYRKVEEVDLGKVRVLLG